MFELTETGSSCYIRLFLSNIFCWHKLFINPQKMFHGLPPVMSGFGMKMLKKMGWQEGQPLGKMGEGYLEPIAMDVKVDRSGELHSCLVCFCIP